MPFLLPSITDTAKFPEWLNFTAAGRDFNDQETLTLSLVLFEQLQSWVATAWHDPCETDNGLSGYGVIRLSLDCHRTTPSVLTVVMALAQYMVLALSWGGKEVTFDFGVGTNYTHEASEGTFKIFMEGDSVFGATSIS